MPFRGGLPEREAASRHCVTCGDEGILMRVIRVDRMRCLAICIKSAGEPWGGEEVAIDLVEPVTRGQTLLVHAGVALANLDQTGAALASIAAPEDRSVRRAPRHPPGAPRSPIPSPWERRT
jgi:hydrogenase maturation factor